MVVLERVTSVSRDSNIRLGDPCVVVPGGLRVFPWRRAATLNGTPISVTPREWRLLEKLAHEPYRVFSRVELQVAMWGDHGADVSSRAVDSHITRLRHKLGAPFLVNVWGHGYALLHRPVGPVACCPVCGRVAA